MTLSRRIWHVGTAIVLLLLLVSVRMVYWQLVRGDELQPVIFNPLQSAQSSEERLVKQLDTQALADLPEPVRQRTTELLRTIRRGTIYDRNGRPLAYDVIGEDGEAFRFYAEPSLAPVVGYVSGLRLGVAGVELAFNDTLLGLDRLDSQLSRLIHQQVRGSDVTLTIDSRVQRAAADALSGRAGAIVVMDGHSGALLGMASTPTFDPNAILDADYFAGLLNCTRPGCRNALLNRATQGLYPPGSTWKTVTLAAALDSGQVTPDTVFDFGQPRRGPDGIYYVYEVDGHEIVDPNHDESRLNLVRSYAVSANAAFARMGDEMPPQTLIDYAGGFGVGPGVGAPPIEIAAGEGQLAGDLDTLRNDNVLQAATGFGQGELQVSPLHMALVVAGIVNQGNVPVPHLLLRVADPAGNVRAEEPGGIWQQNVIRPGTAQQVAEMMVVAVRNGSGVRAQVNGLTVGGKTGTAEVGGGLPPHAWFIGFAHDGERTVVIAVLVENGGEGSQVAAPIFAQIADVALRHLGEPVDEIVPPPR